MLNNVFKICHILINSKIILDALEEDTIRRCMRCGNIARVGDEFNIWHKMQYFPVSSKTTEWHGYLH